ncbi:ABC transporter substrate-binding protein [Nonomuraea sp. NPDC004297]
MGRVAYLPDHPDIAYWGELGLNIVSPERPTEREGGFWEVLSWENADRYQAGVILVDARSQSMKIEETAAKPTWAKLPAVRAGQLYPGTRPNATATSVTPRSWRNSWPSWAGRAPTSSRSDGIDLGCRLRP